MCDLFMLIFSFIYADIYIDYDSFIFRLCTISDLFILIMIYLFIGYLQSVIFYIDICIYFDYDLFIYRLCAITDLYCYLYWL